MELRVERDALADAVVWTARSLPARPPMQVLLGLLLEVERTSGLEISGFDYEVSSRVRLDATADEPGRVLVPGRLLADIVRSLPAQPVDLRVEGTRVVLTCGPARFTLPTLPVEDYPALPAMPDVAGTLGSDVFASAVAQVALAAGRDDTLPVLTGVRFEIEGDQLTLAATDRYRLAVRTLPWRPHRRERLDDRPRPRPHAVRDRPCADRRSRGHARAGLRQRRGGDDRLRGRRPAHHVAAARGRVPEVPLAAAQREHRGGRGGDRALRRGGQARRPRRGPQRAGAAGLLGRRGRARGRRRRRRAGQRAARVLLGGQRQRRAVPDRVQPAVPARRAGRRRQRQHDAVVHGPDPAGGAHRQERRRAGPPARRPSTATCSCRCACPADPG